MVRKYVLVRPDCVIDGGRHKATVTIRFNGEERTGVDKGGSPQEAYLRAIRQATRLTIREVKDPQGSPDRGEEIFVSLDITGVLVTGVGSSYPEAYIAGVNAWVGPEDPMVQRQTPAEALDLERDWKSRDLIPD